MKQKRNHGGSSGGESSEDERIIQPEEFLEEEHREEGLGEDDDFFESSQDLTQIVPRSVPTEEAAPSPKKRRKEKRNDSSTPPPPVEKSRHVNGYRVREVDVSEIPEHVISNMKRVLPKGSDCTEGLTPDDVAKAASSNKGGVWILKCPKSVSLPNLLAGRKLSLDFNGGQILLGDEEEALTQFMPTDSLGNNIKNRQYEAVSVADERFTQGMMLLLPDSNSFKIVTAPVNGHIIIREAVQELGTPKVQIQPPKPRELPAGIKERHPVYGADFSSIIKKMEATTEPSSKKKKKKKSHDDMAHSWKPIRQNGNTFSGNSSAFPAVYIKHEILDDDEIASSKKKKKKKKNKHNDEDESMIVH